LTVLLDRLEPTEVQAHPDTPPEIKQALREGKFFSEEDPVRYLKDLQRRLSALPKDRSPPLRPGGFGLLVRLCYRPADERAVVKVEQELAQSGFASLWDKWCGRKSGLQNTNNPSDAVVVFFGEKGFPAWGSDQFEMFLLPFAGGGRPIVLASLAGAGELPDLPEDLRAGRRWVDCRPNNLNRILHLMWAVNGYRDYRMQEASPPNEAPGDQEAFPGQDIIKKMERLCNADGALSKLMIGLDIVAAQRPRNKTSGEDCSAIYNWANGKNKVAELQKLVDRLLNDYNL